VARLLRSAQAAQLSLRAYEELGAPVDDAAREVFLEQALERALVAWQEVPLTVDTRQAGAVREEDRRDAAPSGFAQSSPGNMMQFGMMGVMGSASIIVHERTSRTMRRLLTTAISRVGIILGHYLAILAMGVVQQVLMVAFGSAVLGLGYMRQPMATATMVATTALWTSAMGLLIGVLAKSEEQVTMLSIIPSLVLSGLGGAWMPLESTGDVFRTVGHVTPVAWAMDGFKDILVRGLGLEAILLPAGILLAYAAACFGLAVWRFRFE
jgi:ABC-2 type transport system permease protein